jgi:hypothetical protein
VKCFANVILFIIYEQIGDSFDLDGSAHVAMGMDGWKFDGWEQLAEFRFSIPVQHPYLRIRRLLYPSIHVDASTGYHKL